MSRAVTTHPRRNVSLVERIREFTAGNEHEPALTALLAWVKLEGPENFFAGELGLSNAEFRERLDRALALLKAGDPHFGKAFFHTNARIRI